MNKLKEYIKKKKVDNKFKQLGQGYVLSDTANTSNEDPADARARAAAAVEKRLNENASKMSFTQKAVYMQAKRELEEEKRRLAEANGSSWSQQTSANDTASEKPAEEDSTVLYTCDLLEELALPKSEMHDAIETFLRAQLTDEGVESAILMIHSLNKAVPARAAIETIQKYVENVCSNPTEEKFRRIRQSNKVFQEKVQPIKGGVEFLKALGFREESVTTNENTEKFLVLAADNLKPDEMRESLQDLLNGSAVTLKLFRNPKVYSIDPSKPLPSPDLSDDFFRISAAELRRMQEARAHEVERLTTLRTAKMREADAETAAAGGVLPYKYTLIRIRFPNNFLLQGVFNVHESIRSVREFVQSHLDFPDGEFVLSTPYRTGKALHNEKSLAEMGLIPSALLHFDWTDKTMAHFNKLGCPPSYLEAGLERKASLLVLEI